MAETFAEWEEKAEAFYQVEYGFLGRSQRSLFDMRGQTLFMETHFPWSCFEDVSTRIVAADFSIREDSETMKLAEKHGGFWEEGYYMDEGLGWPVFPGEEGAENCFNFLMERERDAKEG